MQERPDGAGNQSIIRQSELRSYGAWRRWPESRKELSFLCKERVCLKPTGKEIGTMGTTARRALRLEQRPVLHWPALENPGDECRLSPQVVPITAAGLQGEQSLVNRTM